MRSAGIAVVGGGVMGASVAYHLALRGRRDIVILDRGDRAGTGSTGRATGGFRAQYGTAINVRLSLLARDQLRRFEADTGVDPGYHPAGYLWLATSAGELATLDAGRRLQHEEGLTEAETVGPDDVARLNPAVRREGIVGGTFCPTDGFLRPLSILDGYLRAAARLGARVEWATEVIGLSRGPGDRITAVQTTRGTMAVEAVVNAAGAWAAPLAALAGVAMPVVPLRRQIAVTAPTAVLPALMPMTIWGGDGFHLRVRDGRVLLLCPSPGVPERPYDDRVDPTWIDAVAATAHSRVPVLKEVPVDRPSSWAGLYEMSPDKHALLGPHPQCPNLYCINGASGHGVMHAPALGRLLAEIICDGRASTLDARCLDPGRFERGELNPVSELL
jgi:sarcosine oxidase subunit beta